MLTMKSGILVSWLPERERSSKLVNFPIESGRLVSWFRWRYSVRKLARFPIESGILVSWLSERSSHVRLTKFSILSGRAVRPKLLRYLSYNHLQLRQCSIDTQCSRVIVATIYKYRRWPITGRVQIGQSFSLTNRLYVLRQNQRSERGEYKREH
jgi:hypothetical protein